MNLLPNFVLVKLMLDIFQPKQEKKNYAKFYTSYILGTNFVYLVVCKKRK